MAKEIILNLLEKEAIQTYVADIESADDLGPPFVFLSDAAIRLLLSALACCCS